MKLKNQRGSVLIMAVVMAGIFAAIASSLVSRYVTLVQENKRYALYNENIRVADELSKIVAAAYEYGKQDPTCAPPLVSLAAGPDNLCFADPSFPASKGNCVPTATTFNSDGYVCLDVSAGASKAIGQNEFHFRVKDRAVASFSSADFVGSMLIPAAWAALSQTAMPTVIPTNSNTGPVYDCSVANPLCQKCGPGQANICFEMVFCSADHRPSSGCAAADKIKIDMMIAR